MFMSLNIILFLQLHILGTSRTLFIGMIMSQLLIVNQQLSSYSSWGGGSLDLVNRVSVGVAQIHINKRPVMCFFVYRC